MKPVTGIIKAVGKGEVLVRLSNTMKVKFKTHRGFKYGEKVFVFFNYHTLKVLDIIYEHELGLSDKLEEPTFEPTEDAVLVPGDEEDQEQEGSLPLFRECFLEYPEEEQE